MLRRGGVEAAQWHVAGIGDFNGDGLADALVLRDDGLLGVGTINGNPATNSHVLGQLGAQWHIAGVGDVNNDGTSDILLKNDSGTYQADLIRNKLWRGPSIWFWSMVSCVRLPRRGRMCLHPIRCRSIPCRSSRRPPSRQWSPLPARSKRI